MATNDVAVRLAREMAEVRRSVGTQDKRLKRVEDAIDEVLTAVKGIQITQTALTNALTSTLSELALSRKLEGRVERLESAVFRR